MFIEFDVSLKGVCSLDRAGDFICKEDCVKKCFSYFENISKHHITQSFHIIGSMLFYKAFNNSEMHLLLIYPNIINFII